jgi:hypothetical protein
LSVAVVFVALGFGYSILWSHLGAPGDRWVQPGDIWVSLNGGHFVGWGDIGDLYSSANGFIVTPGIAIVLAPVAMVISKLGLAGSYPFFNPHPGGWLVLGPVSLALCTPALVAVDAMAQTLGVDRHRRRILCLAEAVALWQIASWGHPEDAIALAFALYALIDGLAGRWHRAAWLLGFGVAFQPLALLLAPLLVALAPDLSERVATVWRAAIPTVLLLAIPLIQSPHATLYALVDQPTYPLLLHPTPWLPLAPVLSHLGATTGTQFALIPHAGFVKVHTGVAGGDTVAPSTARLISGVLALAIGVWAYRHRPGARHVVWLATVCLFGWVFFEPVMAPYYVWPVVTMALLGAASATWPRLVIAVAGVTAAAVWSSAHLAPWVYWAPVVVGLGLAVAVVYPGRRDERSSSTPGTLRPGQSAQASPQLSPQQ